MKFVSRSLWGRVTEAVIALGECTPSQVLALVGRTIPAHKAAHLGRSEVSYTQGSKRYTPADLIRLGKVRMVGQALINLAKGGRLGRVRRGVYTVPPLKLVRVS